MELDGAGNFMILPPLRADIALAAGGCKASLGLPSSRVLWPGGPLLGAPGAGGHHKRMLAVAQSSGDDDNSITKREGHGDG